MARLLGLRGYEVTIARDALSALQAVRAIRFDVLISDLGLPDRSGLELLGELKLVHPMPAIALSGFGTDDDLARSKQAGFDEHLTKPINFQALLQAIARLTGA